MLAISASQTARCGLAFLIPLLLLLTAQMAAAGSFSVSPVRVTITPESRVVALRVHNSGTEPTSVQAELMAWSQKDDEDRFEPSRAVLVTPPIFTIPPGETQVVRVGLRRPPDQRKELSYRLFLQELPPPIPGNFQGLRVVTRMSLPVFVAPAAGEAAPDLRWRMRRTADGDLLVTSLNDGNGHGQVTALHLNLDDGRVVSQRGNTYLLPGAERQWSITPEGGPITSGSEIELTAKVNGNDLTTRQRVE